MYAYCVNTYFIAFGDNRVGGGGEVLKVIITLTTLENKAISLHVLA